MVRRARPASAWPLADLLARQAARSTRGLWRVAAHGVERATRELAAKREPPRHAGRWVAGVTPGPGGLLRHHLFVPPGLAPRTRHPLLVMLHGCGQDAASFARSTRMNALAAREGFLVLYPEQDRAANPQGCWNWFATRSRRAQAEAAAVVAAVDQVAALYPVDRGRVAVAGFSAGAGLAALLAVRHPGRVRAVVMHSGVAPGQAADGAAALQAMGGHRAPRSLPASRAPAGVLRAPADDVPLPPLLVLQGDGDRVVAAANGRHAALAWARALSAREAAPVPLRRGQRHGATRTDFRAHGRVAVSLVEIHGLAHAWSGGARSEPHGDPGGPDASRMAWAFVKRQFARVAG